MTNYSPDHIAALNDWKKESEEYLATVLSANAPRSTVALAAAEAAWAARCAAKATAMAAAKTLPD